MWHVAFSSVHPIISVCVCVCLCGKKIALLKETVLLPVTWSLGQKCEVVCVYIHTVYTSIFMTLILVRRSLLTNTNGLLIMSSFTNLCPACCSKYVNSLICFHSVIRLHQKVSLNGLRYERWTIPFPSCSEIHLYRILVLLLVGMDFQCQLPIRPTHLESSDKRCHPSSSK